jgi:hypothetical protein
MLYLISGAVAAGKSVIGRTLSRRVGNLAYLEEDSRPVTDTEGRLANLELSIEDALELQAQGKDAVFGSQAPLGEVLASPRAVELDGIAPCLLDVHDCVRLDRCLARGVDPAWPLVIDHFCWAAFHRLHARDPKYEQRVLVERRHPRSMWSRWTAWTKEDPRWDVLVYDSTEDDVETTVLALTGWIGRIRERGAPLTRARAWWS